MLYATISFFNDVLTFSFITASESLILVSSPKSHPFDAHHSRSLVAQTLFKSRNVNSKYFPSLAQINAFFQSSLKHHNSQLTFLLHFSLYFQRGLSSSMKAQLNLSVQGEKATKGYFHRFSSIHFLFTPSFLSGLIHNTG